MTENTLGLFHSELVRFLKENIEQRAEREGYDVKNDLDLKKLLEGLKGSSGPFPFHEIIEEYQHLFGARGPIHLEKMVMEAFPPKDFVQLGLGRYYPRMYRGLPRLYLRSHPSQSHIKSNFAHLPSLKKEAAVKSLYSLYSRWPVKGKITLFSWVIGDGLGDFIAAREVLRILRGRFADLELNLIALVQKNWMEKILAPAGSLVIGYEKECPLSVITEEAKELLKSSDFILQMPTYYLETEKLFEEIKKPFASVGEYGFVESSWFHPKSGNHSFGLHFLEKGILVRKPIEASWRDVKNENLLKWRKDENHFYLAYLTSPIGGAIYLHALLKSLEGDSKDIDLCVPDLGWFIQLSEKQQKKGRSLLEWSLGVGSIEVYYADQVYEIKLAPEGKRVRILAPGSISQSDFRILLALSGDWVAVRGDQSFSEAISQGKPFFYDGRDHARYFLKDLLALAENRIHDCPGALVCFRGMAQGFLYNLSPEEGEWVDESFFQGAEEWTSIALGMGLSLQDPDTFRGYRIFSQIIFEEFSANGFLVHLVQRALCHIQNPYLEKEEARELELFANGKQTFFELIQNVKQLVEKGENRYGSI